MNTRHQINSYFAVLIITAVGSFATLILVRVVTTDAIASTYGTEASYLQLQQSILKSR